MTTISIAVLTDFSLHKITDDIEAVRASLDVDKIILIGHSIHAFMALDMQVAFQIAQTLKAIKCPILLALGRYDYFNPPHLWEAYRDYAANLSVRIFEKSSHTPQFEESENFDVELIKWLNI